GRLLERREMLLELLQEKFGEPTDAERAEVDEADAETLARYIERVVRADSIAAVLANRASDRSPRWGSSRRASAPRDPRPTRGRRCTSVAPHKPSRWRAISMTRPAAGP